MNMTFNGAPEAWIWFGAIIGLVVSLVWVYIGWRAMKAHERLARATEQIARTSPRERDETPL